MKVVSTEALTKLIQLVKSAFVSVDDTVETSEVELATVAISGSYNDLSDKPTTRNVGEIVESTIPLTDAGLHLLDGSLLAYGSYADFIDYIGDLYDSGNYPDIFETEANWQSAVSTYGVCGKFVYDSVNQTVRLPKITGFVEGTIDPTVLGDLVEAGLPNITGGWEDQCGGNNAIPKTGAFSDSVGSTFSYGWGTSSGSVSTVDFNASNSNPIYGNSTTVQPQTIKVLYYIVIANSTKTAIEVDIDQIATDLNGKADIDFTNASYIPAKTDLSNILANIDYVVETQLPTSSNNYMWYRKYKSGWVEQGGKIANGSGTTTVNLPVTMSDANYCILGGLLSGSANTSYEHMNFNTLTTTSFKFTTYDNYGVTWEVKGKGA